MKLISVIESSSGTGRLGSVVNKDKHGRVTLYTMIFGVKYYGPGGVLARSKAQIEGLSDAQLIDIGASVKVTDWETIKKAKSEMVKSLTGRIEKGKPPEHHPMEVYEDDDGESVRGIRQHRDTGTLYIAGIVVRRQTLVEGAERKKVNSADKTRVKQAIKRLTPEGSYRTLKIDTTSRVRADGLEFEALTLHGETTLSEVSL